MEIPLDKEAQAIVQRMNARTEQLIREGKCYHPNLKKTAAYLQISKEREAFLKEKFKDLNIIDIIFNDEFSLADKRFLLENLHQYSFMEAVELIKTAQE